MDDERDVNKPADVDPVDAVPEDAVPEDAVSEDAVSEDAVSEDAMSVDGVAEAEAEASIAAIVEAERAAEAEEDAVAAAEEAAELEEPAEPEEAVEPADEPESEPEPDPEPVPAPVAAPAKPKAAKAKAAKPVARRLAVLGSPIEHSQSPALHRAAYDVLGLDWEYEADDVTGEALAGFIDSRGPEWRGLSLTMPLKQSVVPLLGEIDRVAEQTGVANTVLLDDDGVLRGYNTDVPGLVRALSAAGLESARFVHILGGGATAASALVAAAELGAEKVDVYVRSLERSVWLEPLAHQLGLMVRIRPLSQADRSLEVPDLVVSTLPGGAKTEALYTDSTRRKALLFDVSYDPWPSAIGRSWEAVGGRVVSGLALLAHQALLQVRIFVSGDPLQPLEGEDAVLAAMLDAVGIDESGAPLED